jgi:hypothetical protein
MKFYKLNTPNVSVELFDNEVLTVNLKSGHYHSVHDSGALFLTSLLEGNSFETALNLVANHYNLSTESITEDFTTFVNQLVTNELLLTVDTSIKSIETNHLTFVNTVYTQPLLEVHTDMEDLVLLY